MIKELVLKSTIIRVFILLTVFCFILQTLGCNAQNENIKKFGVNADYYLALRLLDQNNENKVKEAQTKLKRCIKKGDKVFAKKSARKLCQIGTIQEQIKNGKSEFSIVGNIGAFVISSLFVIPKIHLFVELYLIYPI